MPHDFTRRIGFHAKCLDDFLRLSNIEGVNLVELKPRRDKDFQPYYYDNGVFRINHDLAARISDVANEKGMQVQIHVPYATHMDINDERGLCQALPEHHEKLLDRLKVIQELFERYNIGQVVTTHPPAYLLNGEDVVKPDEATRNGNELYQKIEDMMRNGDITFDFGVENVTPEKRDTAVTGYNNNQLKQLLYETEAIGFTVDTGHRKLTEGLSVKNMFAKGNVVNLHFHTNPGIFNKEGFDDDVHRMATEENLEHFDNYITAIRRNELPVVCEVADFGEMNEYRIAEYVGYLRERLN